MVRRRTAVAGLALLSGALLASVLLVRVSRRGAAWVGSRDELDDVNPFGGVQDEELPDQLGQPPVLSSMMHTEYPPGFNQNGQPVGSAYRLPQQQTGLG